MLTLYKDLARECRELFAGERDFFANGANFCSLLYHGVECLNWVGFYLLSGDELLLGPFQGKPACIRIRIGAGVCGFAAELRETVVVEDVHSFKGHIACDSASRSEIVIPMVEDGKLYGVLDIDSPVVDRFSEGDRVGLEELLRIFVDSSDLKKVWVYYNT